MHGVVTLGKCLSHPNNVRVLALVFQNELCKCEIEYAMGKRMGASSTALKMLTDVGLLRVRRRGKWAGIRINSEFGELVTSLFRAYEDDFDYDQTIQADRRRLSEALALRVDGWCSVRSDMALRSGDSVEQA